MDGRPPPPPAAATTASSASGGWRGADEAGRGCLAGPLVAAAVCLDMERLDTKRLAGLDDSKKVPPPLRDELAAAICATAAAVSVIIVPADQIDRRGLHRSNLHALARALETLEPVPEVALTDGFSLPVVRARAPAGDRRRPHLGRDRCGVDHRQDRRATGSCTAQARATRTTASSTTSATSRPTTRAAVRRHGVTPLHRRSFEAMAYVGLLD